MTDVFKRVPGAQDLVENDLVPYSPIYAVAQQLVHCADSFT